jgi:hypothetical protein
LGFLLHLHKRGFGLLGDHTAARLAAKCCPCFGPPKVKEETPEVRKEEVPQAPAPQEAVPAPVAASVAAPVAEQEVKQEQDKSVDKMTTKVWIM